MNRLKIAEEKDASNATSWKQTYNFDRFGNRTFDQNNTSFPTSFANPNVTNPQIDTNNNKFTTGQGYTYDLAGNLLTDAEGRSFTYDAENKQKDAKNSSNQTLGQYWYDGDGKRVKKIGLHNQQSEETIFVYDVFGKLIEEYSTQLSTTPQVQYLTNDNLGTPRINTDKNGTIVSRSDYMPYGEEIIGLGGRSSADKYVSDDIREGFTGYIKDDETGLNFAEARYFVSNFGRYSSPDPIIMTPQRIINPQRLNLYVYAVNNPFAYIDKEGEEVVQLGEDSEKKIKAQIKEKEAQIKKDKNNEVLKAELIALRQTLSIVQEGNRVVGAWLDALKARGEDQGLTLADFKATTNPVDDLTEIAKSKGKSNDYISIGRYEWGQTGTTATVIDKDIYVLTTSSQYNITLGTLNGQVASSPDTGEIPNGDLYLVGGSTLLHEKDHRDNRATETTAYTNQIKFLDRMNTNKPFKNQKYFKKIKEGYQNLLNYYQTREGVK